MERLSQAKKVGNLAELYQYNVAPHNYYSHLATFVSASLCAVLPNVRIMEVDVDDVPWKDELVTNRPEIVNGAMTVPTGPRLGHGPSTKTWPERTPGAASGQWFGAGGEAGGRCRGNPGGCPRPPAERGDHRGAGTQRPG